MNLKYNNLFHRPVETFAIAITDTRTKTVLFVSDSDPDSFALTNWLGDAELWYDVNQVQEIVAQLRVDRGHLLDISVIAVMPAPAEYANGCQPNEEMQKSNPYKGVNILKMHTGWEIPPKLKETRISSGLTTLVLRGTVAEVADSDRSVLDALDHLVSAWPKGEVTVCMSREESKQ
jgi:hypothetical protein